MVLELLKYAKSAIKKFDQSEASIVVMWLPEMGIYTPEYTDFSLK